LSQADWKTMRAKASACDWGKAVATEGLDLREDPVSQLAVDVVCGQSLIEPFEQQHHLAAGAFGTHRTAQLVGVCRSEPRGVHRDLHDLFLFYGG
jgi:hypothetical protein